MQLKVVSLKAVVQSFTTYADLEHESSSIKSSKTVILHISLTKLTGPNNTMSI